MEDYPLDGRRYNSNSNIQNSTHTNGSNANTREHRRIVYKKISIPVTQARKYISHAAFTLEKNIEAVLAITMTADDEEKVFKLTQRLEIKQPAASHTVSKPAIPGIARKRTH